jgi:G-rich domain on putative tyrosine kinase
VNLEPGQLYPSLRRLPLLGVTYADLYRRVKVQETLYEVLTRQYELAKVQEAREIPTVKVLDQPAVPEKKSFPPRLLIISMGTVLTALLFGIRLSSENFWRNLPRGDARKILACEVRETIRSRWRRMRFRFHSGPEKDRSGLTVADERAPGDRAAYR